MRAADWVGSIGVGMLLLAFVLNLTRRLEAGAPAYRALNLAGASLACWASVMIDYAPFVVLEGVWALAALAALLRPPGAPPPTDSRVAPLGGER
jgi:hypothetical protein